MDQAALRLIVAVLAIPAACALWNHLRGHAQAAQCWNAVLPGLVLVVCVVAIAHNGLTRITAGGVALTAFPAVVLLAAWAGIKRPSTPLFWGVWACNIAILAFMGYLAFAFRIF